MTKKLEPEVCNHTCFDLAWIEALPVIKTVRSNWRKRDVRLYQHPGNPDRVFSVGVSDDKMMTVVCEDAKTAWARELEDPAPHVVTN